MARVVTFFFGVINDSGVLDDTEMELKADEADGEFEIRIRLVDGKIVNKDIQFKTKEQLAFW